MAKDSINDWEDVPPTKPAAATPSTASVSDWEDVPVSFEPPKKLAPTEVESFLGGALDSGTLGFSDEIAGMVGAAPDLVRSVTGDDKADYKKSYRTSRDKLRDYLKNLETTNPKAYLGGNVTGGVATAFLPGINAAKGASLLNLAGKSAIAGGLQGLGGSEGETAEDDLKAAGKGAAFGGVLGGAAGAAGKALGSISPNELAKKLGKTFLGAPEEAVERYMKNPEAVNAALPRRELTQKMLSSLDDAKDRITSGSKASRDILDKEGLRFSGDDVTGILKSKRDALLQRMEGVSDDPERAAALKALEDRIKAYSGSEQVGGNLLDASGQPVMKPKDLSANRIKDLVQSLQKQTDYEIAPGRFSPADNETMKQVSGEVNQLLKSKSPAYATAMEDVAKDTAVHSDLTDRFKSDRGLDNLFKQIQQDRGFDSAESLGEFDKRFGTDYLPQLKDSYTKEAFDKGSTQGSRKVKYFSELGNAYKGPAQWAVKPALSTVGMVADPYGPKLAKKAIDAASNFDKFMAENGYLLGPAADALGSIYSKSGPQAASTALYLMAKKDPTLRKALLGKESEEK